MAQRVRSVHVVYAEWCPHCVPTVVEPMREASARLGARFEPHDIDSSDVGVADELVKKCGDWTEDYLIPQVFLEFDDGSFKHVLTGDPRGVAYTRRALDGLLSHEPFLQRRP